MASAIRGRVSGSHMGSSVVRSTYDAEKSSSIDPGKILRRGTVHSSFDADQAYCQYYGIRCLESSSRGRGRLQMPVTELGFDLDSNTEIYINRKSHMKGQNDIETRVRYHTRTFFDPAEAR